MTESEWLECDDPLRMLRLARHKDYAKLFHMSDRKLRLFACACCRAAWDGVPCWKCSGSGWIRVNAGLKPEPGGASGYEWKRVDCPGCRGSGKVGGLTDERSRRAVGIAERYADGLATEEELAGVKAWVWCDPEAAVAALRVVNIPHWIPPARMAALLRDIVGNPFRRVTLPSVAKTRREHWSTTRGTALSGTREVPDGTYCPWLVWRDGTVPKLAQTIYDNRSWDALPQLADALEEAGCVVDADVGRLLRGIEAVGNIMAVCRDDEAYRLHSRHLDDLRQQLDRARTPHPLLAHLRGPGPHVRGCCALDLLLGKE
jgi:hypothetical protein